MNLQRFPLLISPDLVAVNVAYDGESLQCSGLYRKPDSRYRKTVALYSKQYPNEPMQDSYCFTVQVPPNLPKESLGAKLDVISIARIEGN